MAREKKNEDPKYSKQFAFFGTPEMNEEIEKLMLATMTFNKSEMIRQVVTAGIEKLKQDNNIA